MNKNILITGSTDGIGRLCAEKLASEGHRIYVHGRNKEKLIQTVSEIKQTSGHQNIEGYLCDFADLESVKNWAIKIKNDIPKLDVLINNAGVFQSPQNSNNSDIDLRFKVNYLAPYLLTNQLMDLLEKSSQPRIINLSSAAQAPVSLPALLGSQHIGVQAAYAQSKLALTMWSFDLAKKHPDMIIIPVNPGSLLNTKMANEAYGQYWSPADKGSKVLCYLATSDEVNKRSGQYFDNDKGQERGEFSLAHPDSLNSEKIENLISTTETILSLFSS